MTYQNTKNGNVITVPSEIKGASWVLIDKPIDAPMEEKKETKPRTRKATKK